MSDAALGRGQTGFVVAARTILELGAELISSDGIALYELIKNAYDAGSRRATIKITNTLRFSVLRNTRQRIDAAIADRDQRGGDEPAHLERLRGEVLNQLDPSALRDVRTEFLDILGGAATLEAFRTVLQEAFDSCNRIEITDTGEGMSLEDLTQVYLTIGTRSRLAEPAADGRRYVGGKGLGRLSAMRLGGWLEVITTRAGEARRNELRIDWSRFTHTSDALLEEIEIRPQLGEVKGDPAEQGTTIRISGLLADWDLGRVQRLVNGQFDRLFDPFGRAARFPLVISVNGTPVVVPVFDRRILTEAQAKAEIRYFNDPPRFVADLDYIVHGRTKQIVWDVDDILGITSGEEVSSEAMRTVGPFSAHFHWFNRQKLKSIDGFGDRNKVRDTVNDWANGLMMYRDGFRVNPYGAPDDDWLHIDMKALGSSGYKVNRKQLIGAVNISAVDNPHLVDQTNREGLRNNEERQLMVVLLQKLITEEFRNFLNAVEREIKKSTHLSVKDTTQYLDSVSKRVKAALRQIAGQVSSESLENVSFLTDTFEELEDRLRTARDAITTAEREQRDLVNLAGIGLLVEIVSHELGRVARRTLELIGETDRSRVPREVAATFESVESQMLIIRRRLDLLDPLSPSGRNRRETFDLRALVEQVLESHQAQFDRFGIAHSLRADSDRITIKAVKGMIVQVLENLLDNSVFWLRQRLRMEPGFRPEMRVDIDICSLELRITDNGPGIAPARAEEVFRPFVSSKPPGEGKGLGLYIAKEIARYHGSDLYLLDEQVDGKLHTFVLDIDGLQE